MPGLLDPRLDPMSGSAQAMPGMTPDIGQIPVAALPVPQRQPGLLERMLPVPSGYQGLLSPQDLHNARSQALLHLGASLLGNSSWQPGHPAPGFGAALGQGLEAGMGSFQQGVQGALQQNMQGTQVRRMQALEAARQNISARYPSVPGETPEQTIGRVTNMALEYANAGDPETAGKLASLAHALREAHGLNGDNMQSVPVGWGAVTYNKRTGLYYDPKANNGVGGWVPSIERGIDTDTKQYHEVTTGLRKEELANSATKTTDAEGKAFEAAPDVKAYISSAQPYALAKDALRQSAAGNGTAYKTSIMAFARALDPKAQMRSQMLGYISQMDPTLVGSLEARLDKLSDAKFTPRVMQGMNDLLEGSNRANMVGYERAYRAYLASHPGARLRSTSDVFGSPSAAPASIDAYSRDNPFAGKP